MSELAIKRSFKDNTSSTCKVLPFPQKKPLSESWEDDYLVSHLLGNSTFEGYVKEIVEAAIYSNYAAKLSSALVSKDNPFDSIYLSELMSDTIEYENVEKIKFIATNIIDKSDLIEFNDGWDD